MTRQFTTPLLIRNGQAEPLHRVPFFDRTFNESRLQQLLFENPSLLPVRDIEPLYDNLVPIARELPTPVGPIDLVYINSDGFITMAETKLWRNPDARRSVVAQIIDYAKEMARWSYDELNAAGRRAGMAAELAALVKGVTEDADEFSEVEFIDRVSRNLRLGRFLLLIVGDGIREDVEHMAEFLQKTPQLGFTLGLVEMALFREHQDSDESFFVQPRLLARTREVTRAIVEVRAPSKVTDIDVAFPIDPPETAEAQFFLDLSQAVPPPVVDFVRWALQQAPRYQLEVKWGEGGPLLHYVDEGASFRFLTFGQFQRRGFLSSAERLCMRCQRFQLPDEIWQRYYDDMVALIPGVSRTKYARTNGQPFESITFSDRKLPIPLAQLMPRKEGWFDAIARAIQRAQDSSDEMRA